jgi:hypothetical protein
MAAALLGYTVGARVICPGSGSHGLHMTLAYVGECDAERLRLLIEELQARATHPIQLELGADEMFGPPEKRNIPVVLCRFVNPDVAALWRSFYEKYAELEPGQPEPKPALQTYHISVKHPGSKEALRAMPQVVCQYVQLKRIGPHDPVAVVPLRRVLYDQPVADCRGEHPHCPCSDCSEFHHK